MGNLETIFKAYDVRGIYPEQLDEEFAGRIGEAFIAIRKPKKVAVGQDVRLSGNRLKEHLISALLNNGVNVVDIGTITTDQLYFTVGNYGLDGGISVTASHNPSEYNGFKFAETGGGPISSADLEAMRDWALSNNRLPTGKTGKLTTLAILDDYINHVLSYIDIDSIKPLQVFANANFGAVGRGLDILAKKLNLKLYRLNWKEDGSFPKGPPNPLLPENREESISYIKKVKPDLGVAWDADADRCFFFTGDGEFIPSCYTVALLAKDFLKKYPGSKIVHDITTSWVIDDVIKEAGGIPVTHRTGHTFIKARMRHEDAPFAGESSGHYYFRDSFYADNGIVPFLKILEMISKSGKSLKELTEPLMTKYKVSGEINFQVASPIESIKLIEAKFGKEGRVDKTDGLAIDSKDWRFSVRPSNTEPLFRLNAESHNQEVLDELVKEISHLINT
ncbi:MAG TPA: phosphomannomutase/phosphoglucomutase [Candidatus Saccharimonadales bacterium]|nr:phosphomannomutase/phosphoglucomutase [Candidatus Saccharimonadales bacterium]